MLNINQYKHLSGRITEDLIKDKITVQTAIKTIINKRKTKGYRSALITGLLIGALIERGKPEIAEIVLISIASNGE